MADDKTKKKPPKHGADPDESVTISEGGALAGGEPPVLELKPGEQRDVPVLPVRNTVLFPLALLPLNVGREKSVKLLNKAMATDRVLAIVPQKDPTVEEPTGADLQEIGTLASVVRMVRSSDDTLAVLVQGVARVRLSEQLATEPWLRYRTEIAAETSVDDIETEALVKNVISQFERAVQITRALPPEAVIAAREQKAPGRIADFIASLLELSGEEKQGLLATLDVKQRLRALTAAIARLLQVLEVGQQIQESVKESLDERQREFLLRQQMDAIRKELGEGDDTQREIGELKEKIEKSGMPEAVRKEADRELARLERIPPQAAEYNVARTYLEWLCDMPWTVATEDNLDLAHVRQILDEDHFGLDKIKDRLLEFLAVRRYKSNARSPILCFAGPPGTGKTSLGKSMARALGRKFVRQSLGGVRDEAEIRGHRRTYIGALPGNIIQSIRRAGSHNPLFMLDEVDKLGADFRGDPASALLEVLDPEQNHAFVDHYLDVPFDLTQVMFVCTANYLDPVPPALRDRMEVIELSSYTELEKVEIAKRHLIPKIIYDYGLGELKLSIEDGAVLAVVRQYTREAGLRNLERELANLMRRTVKAISEDKKPPRTISADRARELLGPPIFADEKPVQLDAPGAALGLAWTPVGGEVLTIESTAMPGARELILTGQLGDVMRESALAALSYIRSNAVELEIDPNFYDNVSLHVHIPAGAIPKDGPSAGVALCTALVSLLTQRKPRKKMAMTGELTLRGNVLKVGGIKEKVLGAHRCGLSTVILPVANESDLEDVPVEVRTHMIFAPVERVEQVFQLALEPEPIPIENEADKEPVAGNGGSKTPAGDGEQEAPEPSRPYAAQKGPSP